MSMTPSLVQAQRIALLASACLAASGCFEAHVTLDRDAETGTNPADSGSAAPPDAAPPEVSEPPVDATAGDGDGPVSCRTPDVDMLFVIDNSGSMAEEQKKLARTLPQLLGILATGNHDGKRRAAGVPTDFVPARTMHVGVVSTDLGVNLAPAISGCGGASFDPAAPDPSNTSAEVASTTPNNVRLEKPFGDNGQLQISTAVAQAGIWSRPVGTTFSEPVSLVVEPDPSCALVRPNTRYLEYGPGDVFEELQHGFSCIAKLGKNGCGFEQQLESMLKALAPASERFSRFTQGQGTAPGTNAGFLRDDAILVVVIVSDEEDCSIPDDSSELFNRNSPTFQPGDINTRCGKPQNQQFLNPIERYVDGLRALKSSRNQGRIIVASIAGIPLAADLGDRAVHNGSATLAAILERPDMQFTTRASSIVSNEEAPVPTCISGQGDGSAAPARRLLQLTRAFGDNGMAASICEDDYQATVQLLGERISRHLGSCE
jgi:hypothetical protein